GIGSPGASFSIQRGPKPRAGAIRTSGASIPRREASRATRAPRELPTTTEGRSFVATSSAFPTIASMSRFANEGRFRSGATRWNPDSGSVSPSSATLRPDGDDANPCKYRIVFTEPRYLKRARGRLRHRSEGPSLDALGAHATEVRTSFSIAGGITDSPKK